MEKLCLPSRSPPPAMLTGSHAHGSISRSSSYGYFMSFLFVLILFLFPAPLYGTHHTVVQTVSTSVRAHEFAFLTLNSMKDDLPRAGCTGVPRTLLFWKNFPLDLLFFTTTLTASHWMPYGLTHPAKWLYRWKEADKHRADISSVQKTHFSASQTPPPQCYHRDYPHVSLASTQEKKRCVLLAIKNTLAFQLKESVLDIEGRYIILTCYINEHPYTLVALYTLNSHQLCFLRKFSHHINAIRYGSLLICGDFNLTADPLVDSTAKTGKRVVSLHPLLYKEDVYDT